MNTHINKTFQDYQLRWETTLVNWVNYSREKTRHCKNDLTIKIQVKRIRGQKTKTPQRHMHPYCSSSMGLGKIWGRIKKKKQPTAAFANS